MGNIKNFNFNKLDLRLSNSEYWDFYLGQEGDTSNCLTCVISDDCVVVNFEFYNNEIYLDGVETISSLETWSNSINSGVSIPSFGLTGLDNGSILFNKNPLDYENHGLVNILTGTTLTIASGYTNLILSKVSGYTGQFSYPLELASDSSAIGDYMNFKGGFYQGFYKLDGYDYEVLPNRVNKGLMFEFWLNKDDDIRTNFSQPILNDSFPNNKGIFMYLGTRAENKFWNQFEGNNSGATCNSTSTNFCTTIKESDVVVLNDNGYGLPLNPPQIIFTEIKNEFLLYGRAHNRRCDIEGEGFKLGTLTACEVTGATPTFIITSTTQTTTNILNPFLIYGRSKGSNNCGSRPSDGYGRETICSFSGTTSDVTELDVDSDIIDNALAFIIKDDGRIGYRLMTVTASCVNDKTISGTTIKEEFSVAGTVQNKQWEHISIRWTTNYYGDCDLKNGKRRTGKLMFYVNCRLKFVVNDFPEFIAKRLNEYKEKQVGVPYNISLGGGSQGLLESMTFDGQDLNDLGLKIEQNFAGTFIGSISQFKIYNCDVNWCAIKTLCKNDRYGNCLLIDELGNYVVDEEGNNIIVSCL